MTSTEKALWMKEKPLGWRNKAEPQQQEAACGCSLYSALFTLISSSSEAVLDDTKIHTVCLLNCAAKDILIYRQYIGELKHFFLAALELRCLYLGSSQLQRETSTHQQQHSAKNAASLFNYAEKKQTPNIEMLLFLLFLPPK